MAKIIFKNLEFVYDEPFLGRGRAWKYEVITHRNRDRKGGHIHRRWFETGEMKRHYRVTDRRKRYNQINRGIEDHFDALEDHGKEFDWQGNQTNDDWYDDEPMDLPDWWYDPSCDDRDYPDCMEEEDSYEPDDYQDFYDPWDDYHTPEYDYRHDDAPSYMSLAREVQEDQGETLGEILRRHL